jgi:hypothetical protein
VGFSRYLETKTLEMAQKRGPAAARAMTLEIGQRVVWSSAEDRHGEVAVERVDRFFELARQTAPERAGAGRAKKKTAKKTAAKKTSLKQGSLKKSSSTKGAAKKASKVPATKKKTEAAERKTSTGKGKVNPLLKTAARGIATRVAKKVAKEIGKKALAKAVKKSAKRSRS